MENEKDLKNSIKNFSSQNNSVSSFGNSSSDSSNLKQSVESNKQKNLSNKNVDINQSNLSNIMNSNVNSLSNNVDNSNLKSRINESRARNTQNNVRYSNDKASNQILPKSNELNNVDKKDSFKKESSKIDGDSSNKSASKKGGLGSFVGNSALNLAASKSETVNKGVQTVNFVKTTKKVINAIISFFASPLGWGTLLVAGIILAIVFVGMFAATIINSIASFFGLTGNETYDSFGEKYEEGMSTSELDSIMKDYEDADGDNLCDRGFFTATKNFFGIYNTSDPCELTHYVRKMIDNKEAETKISVVAPGYFMSVLYYAYDSQNTDEDGNFYIKPDVDEENLDSINDLDAITTILSSHLYDKTLRSKILDSGGTFYKNIFGTTALGDLFTTESAKFLLGITTNFNLFRGILDVLNAEDDNANKVMLNNILDQYIIHYRNYSYFTYELVESDNGEEDTKTCVAHDLLEYDTSDDKFKLYLRYGARVSQAYEEDLSKALAYDRTDNECKGELGFDKPNMDKYKIKANTDTTEDDKAKITIDSGTYGYDSGFIYNTYPRYLKEFSANEDVVYNYWIDKDIEQIISNIESRQDYMNYILGYPSSIKKDIISSGAVCSYNINGANVSNIKVRLLHAASNDAIPDVEAWAPIEGQDLIDFDKYILGVVYGEEGGAPVEAMKVQAIAAASYALGNVSSNGTIRMIEENGVNILEISSSNFHQGYCDPDKGCYICYTESSSNATVLTAGTIPKGANCKYWKGPLPDNSNIRSAVREVNGMVLTDNNGKIFPAGYKSDSQKSWNEMAKSGLDYVEILRKHYGSEYSVSSPTCTYGATGEWASWRQYDSRWGSKKLSTKTLASVGCFITSYSMILAKSAPSLAINDFNPGTFLDVIKQNNCLSGNNLYSACAINAALGEGTTYSQNGIALSGSYEQKVALISQYLNQGYDIMLRVKSPESARKYGESDQHWVVVTGINGTDILMADPASDATIVLDKYHEEGIVHFQYIKFNKE